MRLYAGELFCESTQGGEDSREHHRHKEKQTLLPFPTSKLVHWDWQGHKGKLGQERWDETGKK